MDFFEIDLSEYLRVLGQDRSVLLPFQKITIVLDFGRDPLWTSK